MYCRVCHRQKPAGHFDMYPDHNAQGAKRTLTERYASDDEGDNEGAGLHLGPDAKLGPLMLVGGMALGLVALVVAAARSVS
ncbi:MAG: hypothetical protein IVW57_04460 [Ktedonobacterales bacterium]|nr:hypothetical protein [Ktedonobacterales bacterium]